MRDAKVVLIHNMPDRGLNVILGHNPEGFETLPVHVDIPEADVARAVEDADFLFMARARLSESVLRAATKVRLVQLTSAGYDGFNVALMRELGIPCANNGGANSWAVSDHTLLLILSVYRRLSEVTSSIRQGAWAGGIGIDETFELAGKVVGIIGLGNIGRRVARRLQGFEATVQYNDICPLPPDRERDMNVSRVELDELLATSDIVTCHVPLTNQTCHMVSEDHLAMMKPTAILVNTSRGPVVDEPALIDALQKGTIAGAGLDVFEREPVDPANPLLGMENVVATPHIAGATWESWYRRSEFGYRNMKRVWDGQPPLAVVDTETT